MKKTILLFAAVMFVAAACKTEEPVADSFSIDRTSVTADAEGTTASLVITANCAWTVSNSLTWVTVTPASGSGSSAISVKVAQNTGLERSGSFTVTGGTVAPVEISVSQGAAKSDMKLGTPALSGKFEKDVASTAAIEIPYTNAMGTEKVAFDVDITGNGSAGYEKATTEVSFKAGSGTVSVPISWTPTEFGSISIQVSADNEVLGEALEARVAEAMKYATYVTWNFWGAGYTRQDYALLRGSDYDASWTNESKTATDSKVASDHHILPSGCTLEGAEGAYFSASCASEVTAGGETTGPAKVSSVAGYTFNPGMQIQGLLKDDYFFVTIPVKSLAAGTKVNVEASMGSAAGAAGYFIMEYSVDGTNWAEAPDAKTIEVEGTSYKYHYSTVNSTDKTIRYTYSRDITVDAGYAKYTMAIPAALSNATLQIRLRANGLNGSSVVQSKAGWSDVKFFEVSFE